MTLTFSTFNPEFIPWQDDAMDVLECQLDYAKGVYEILLAGSVGSAKTSLGVHQAVKHCLKFTKARVGIGRRSLPDIKKTIFTEIVEHIDQDGLMNRVKIRESTATIKFLDTGSIMEPCYWADKRYKKFRSRKYSMLLIEELTENDEEDKQAYEELLMRLGRIPHIDENLAIAMTNPDSPSHWVYKRFFGELHEMRRAFQSKTSDNPFLPATYISNLRRSLDPKMARRMIDAEWLDIRTEVIYYAYEEEVHFKRGTEYQINKALPIRITFDFNIGDGKPMSAAVAQYDDAKDTFHGFEEAVIEGARTESILEDMLARGIFDHDVTYFVHGDATGSAQSTSSKLSNYEIIKSFLSNVKNRKGQPIRFEMHVPKSNPPIRTRHNLVNGYLRNDLKQVRTYVYGKCKVLNDGLKMTALKKGANYVEDDSKPFQHITTAWGYMVCYVHMMKGFTQGSVHK